MDYGNFFTVTFVPDTSATIFNIPASADAETDNQAQGNESKINCSF